MADSIQWKIRGMALLAGLVLAWISGNTAIALPGNPPDLVKLAQEADANRAAAEKIFAQAEQLRKQATAESLKAAIAKYLEALQLYQTAGDRPKIALTLTTLGKVYVSLGDKQQAINYYSLALPLWQQLNDSQGEAVTLINAGRIYDELDDKQKALDNYNQALPLWKALSDASGEATTLSNIGNVQSSLGYKQKALDYYKQALPLFKKVANGKAEAVTLNNMGLVYNEIGEYQQALDYLNQAIALRQSLKDILGVAQTLNNIGLVYDDLGEEQQSLENYNKALPLWRELSNFQGEAVTLNNIGRVYSDLGEKPKALDNYNQALPLWKAANDKGGEASTLSNIGKVYSDLGEKVKALEYLKQSLKLRREVGDRFKEAITLNNIGQVYSESGDYQQAIDYYNLALPLSKSLGVRPTEAIALKNIAFAQRKQGKLSEALTNIESAIQIIESLRKKVTSQELRASYFASKQNEYELYIDLLMQLHKTNPKKGYDAKALQASESSRARSLLEILTEARADIRQGADPKLLESDRTLQLQIDTLEKRRLQLLNNPNTQTQAAELQKQIKALFVQYQEVQTQIRQNSPRYAALTQPQPLSLQEIQQQVLDDDTLLLEYSLGEERSYLWVASKTSLASYELPPRAQIEKAARLFRDTLTIPSKRNIPKLIDNAANSLSQLILAPVASQLGSKRLLIVSDGALQYIPFSALTVTERGRRGASFGAFEAANSSIKQTNIQQNLPSKQPESSPVEQVPLIVEHEILTLPSVSTLAVLRRETNGRQSAPKTVAVFADPIFGMDDERVNIKIANTANPQKEQNSKALPIAAQQLEQAASEAGIQWNRLPFTRVEADRILALVAVGDREQAFDSTANREAAISETLSNYRIVHFATHGFANSTHPELSGLVMSLVDEKGTVQNGYLRLHDIFNLNLPAELVVLSACQTGLGKEIKGEGLVGLTRGFMYAGAARVVVSLWSVNDQATSELMVRFYQKMLKDGLAPAAALRAAQVELLQQTEWKSPYYWAAFGLQGEWK